MAMTEDGKSGSIYDFSNVPEVGEKAKAKYELIRDGLERIKGAIAQGKSKWGLAEHFGLSYSTFTQYLRRAERESANAMAKERRKERDFRKLRAKKDEVLRRADRESLRDMAKEYGVQLKTLRFFVENDGKTIDYSKVPFPKPIKLTEQQSKTDKEDDFSDFPDISKLK